MVRLNLSLNDLKNQLNNPDPKIRKRAYNTIKQRESRARLKQGERKITFKPRNNENLKQLRQHLDLEQQWDRELKTQKREQQKLQQKLNEKSARQHQLTERKEQRKWSKEIESESRRRVAVEDAKIRANKYDKTTGNILKDNTGKRLTKKVRIKNRAKLSNKLVKIFGKRKWKNENTELKIYPVKPDGTIVRDGSYDAEALTRPAVDYIIENTLDKTNITGFLVACEELITGKILLHGTCKTQVKVKLTFGRTDPETGREETNDSYFSTKFNDGLHLNPNIEYLNEYYTRSIDKIIEHINNYRDKGSGWYIKTVNEMWLGVTKYTPDYGATWIPIPECLEKSKSIINVNNNDNECFRWCITRALNPVKKDQNRVTKLLREQTKLLDWSDINFPSSILDFKKFEDNNKNIALKIYSWDNKNKTPVRLYYSKKTEFEHCVYLLHITESVDKKHPEFGNQKYEPIGHFTIILKPTQFFSKYSALHESCENEKTPSHHKFYPCEKCAVKFYRESTLIRHQKYCDINKPTTVFEGGIMEFKNYKKMIRNPIRTYTDFESYLEPTNNKLGSKTTQTQQHIACSFHTTTITFDGKIQHYTYKGLDAPAKYIKHIENVTKKFYEQYKPKPLIITPEIENEYKNATNCWICNKKFNDPDNQKVRDHCHYTGKFRGIAHNNCNLKLKESVFVPNIIHNMYGYDVHMFIREIATHEKDRVSCIAKDNENLISMSKNVVVDWVPNKNDLSKNKPVTRKLVFMDSLKFLNASLDSLVKNLPTEKMKITKNKFPDQNQFNLVTQKGVYPYDYMDSYEKFKETKLPPWSCWFNKLTGKDITESEKQHVKNVWKTFKCKNLEDYHDIYLQSDTTLLADVFEDFIESSFNTRSLDPLHYVTLPGYGWDCMLQQSKIKLNLFESDQAEMCNMFKRGIRGGVSTSVKRYAKANNKYLSDYDETKPSSYIVYLDKNNLYGYAMMQSLPTDSFKWMTKNELENWQNVLNENDVGCILEVDLECPKQLHNLHKDLPLPPEKQKVEKVEKLMSTLDTKNNYVVHYKLLDLYIKLGLVIKKIHKGILFDESQFMKSYVDRNTELRSKATNDADKNLYKLMTNAVFGKTMENVENRSIVEFANSEQKLLKLARKPNFISRKILDDNLYMVTMQPLTTNMNKPIYVGQAILDLSKKNMFEFHYDHIKKLYGEKAELLYTDTDSLVYQIFTEDFYKDIKPYVKTTYDTSNYAKDHPLYYTGNKKIPGYMKDECGGNPISEWIGIGSKQYAYRYEKKDENNLIQKLSDQKCKGITKSVTANELNFDEYKKCLDTKKSKSVDVTLIRSRDHNLYTEVTEKVALTFEDDKRHILEDGVHTLPFGHYSLKQN